MDLDHFSAFFARLSSSRLAPWAGALKSASRRALGEGAHGDRDRWLSALAALPEIPTGRPRLDTSKVAVAPARPLTDGESAALVAALMVLHPWRKGPYEILGTLIDSEWRSDWKWDRLAGHIEPLHQRSVLDVGCGNGYHAWRMLGAGADLVLGIDPTLLFVFQFLAINRYLADDRLAVLPLALEDLPLDLALNPGGFDTVFSMGVLYHRRAPAEHLAALRRCLRPGGELVLETLVLAHASQGALVPTERYAGMRNCWYIPTRDLLTRLVSEAGFHGVRLIHCAPTSTDEQRATPWMRFHSLPDQLDPHDTTRTREGHPAPLRAILLARAGD